MEQLKFPWAGCVTDWNCPNKWNFGGQTLHSQNFDSSSSGFVQSEKIQWWCFPGSTSGQKWLQCLCQMLWHCNAQKQELVGKFKKIRLRWLNLHVQRNSDIVDATSAQNLFLHSDCINVKKKKEKKKKKKRNSSRWEVAFKGGGKTWWRWQCSPRDPSHFDPWTRKLNFTKVSRHIRQCSCLGSGFG